MIARGLALGLILVAALASAQTATVRFRIVSTAGEEVTRAGVQLTSLSVGTQFGPAEQGEIRGVPFGRYRVEVQAPMFGTAQRRLEVEVNRAEQWVTVGMIFERSMVRWRTPKQGILRGSVILAPGGGEVWIRVVGVYSRVSEETKLASDGTFEIPGIPEGKYIAIVTGAGRERAVIPFEFTWAEDPVTLHP